MLTFNSKTLELYRKIEVYPQSSRISEKSHLSALAPLAEDDDGRICYPTKEEKEMWLKKIRRGNYGI